MPILQPPPTLLTVQLVRRFLIAALALAALPVSAETVQLRRPGNATIITFEYITLDDNAIMVKRLDSDAVLSYRWDDLDLDWIRKNNPKVWAERELLLADAKAEKKMTKKEAEVDPFAQEVMATDAKSLMKNLIISLQDGMKGLSLSANRVDVVCNEFQLDENLFWLGFEDLKRASQLSGKIEASSRAEGSADENKDRDKTKAKGKTAAKVRVRTPESLAAEADARKAAVEDTRPYNALGYLRNLAEGGTKGKPAWMMLRRATADREAIKAILAKYAAQASELADKPEGKPAKGELIVLKRVLENCGESIGKVTRESVVVEARLQTDCRALLTFVLR